VVGLQAGTMVGGRHAGNTRVDFFFLTPKRKYHATLPVRFANIF
jgi:hypothetical protein